MQGLWAKIETETDTFENILFLLQAYHTSLLQAFLDADNLATNLATFFPPKHPQRPFIDAFCSCQQTLREVANDLLSERFADRTQAPIRARIAKYQKLERLETLRKRLWTRYERDLNRYKDMVEKEAASKRTATVAETAVNSTYGFVSSLLGSGDSTTSHPAAAEAPTSEEINRMKMIVESEYRLYHDTKEHLAREVKALADEATVFLEPVIMALALLQSQTLTLGFDLIQQVIQENPDSSTSTAKMDAVIGKRKTSAEEDLETRMQLVLSHEVDLKDLTLKPIPGESFELDGGAQEAAPRRIRSRDVRGAMGLVAERDKVEDLQASKLETTDEEPAAAKIAYEDGSAKVENEQETFEDASPRTDSPAAVGTDQSHQEAKHEPADMQNMAKPKNEITPSSDVSAVVTSSPPDEESKPVEPVVKSRAIALFDYKSSDSLELSFSRGDAFDVLDVTSHGWWEARDPAGLIGLVPFNFLEVLPPTR